MCDVIARWLASIVNRYMDLHRRVIIERVTHKKIQANTDNSMIPN